MHIMPSSKCHSSFANGKKMQGQQQEPCSTPFLKCNECHNPSFVDRDVLSHGIEQERQFHCTNQN